MHKIIWNRQPRGVRAGLRAVLLAMAGVNAGTIVARSRRLRCMFRFDNFRTSDLRRTRKTHRMQVSVCMYFFRCNHPVGHAETNPPF